MRKVKAEFAEAPFGQLVKLFASSSDVLALVDQLRTVKM